MCLVETVLLLATVSILFYIFAQYRFSYWKRRGIQQSETVFPFGSLKGITKTANLGGILKNKYFESKGLPYYGLNFFLTPLLLLRDPAVIKEVLVKEFSTFHDRGFDFNTEREPLTNHLFFLRGQKWRNLRIKMAPTFTSGKMKMMFPTMLQSSKEMLDFLEEPASRGEEIEVKDVFAKFTTNVIARCAFGLELDSFKNPNSEFRNVSGFLFKPDLIQSVKTTIMFNFSKYLYYVPIYLIPKKVSNFFVGAVAETMKFREDNNVKRNDFLQLLIELKNKGKLEDSEVYSHGESMEGADMTEVSRKFNIGEAAAQAFVFFVAGYETASTALQFCSFELALNPHVQTKLQEEIDAVLARNGGEITYEAVQEMVYLEQVISETLRKYPAAPFIVREARSAIKLPNSDLTLEKGTRIMVPLLGLHYDPQYFPEPEKFDPDRFSPENKDQLVPYSYLPFGEGPRMCIGMRFGMMQMKIGLTQFLSKYRVALCDKSPVPPIQFDPKVLLTAIKGGVFLKVTKR